MTIERVTVGCALRGRALPGQLVEVPVADRAAVGLALGLSLGGKRPVVELDGTHALLAVVEVLAEAVRLGAPLVLTVPCGGEAGPLVDRATVSAVLAVPGVTVVVASDAAASARLVAHLQEAGAIAVVLTPRALFDGAAYGPSDGVAARVLRRGDVASVVTWGAGVERVLAAAESLAHESSVDVIDLVALAPIDVATLTERVRATGRLVIADPGDGVGHAVLWPAVAQAFDWLESPPVVVPVDDVVEAVRAVRAY